MVGTGISGGRRNNMILALIAILVASVVSSPTWMSPSTSSLRREGNATKYCGWELMQHHQIPIAKLGTWYADQTGDRSLCVKQDDGSEYCTCVYQCGNGVWGELKEHGAGKSNSGKEGGDEGKEKERQNGGGDEERGDAGEYARYGYYIQKGLGVKSGKWKYEVGCKKYCHAGVCDGQD